MYRFIVIALLIVSFSIKGWANHITGGEMYYQYIGMANGEYQYIVTLKLFKICNSDRQFPDPAILSVFDKTSDIRIIDLYSPLTSPFNIAIHTPDPCIINPPSVCYDVALYTFNVSLPGSLAGYVLATQVNFRIAGISNLILGSESIGATYSAEIPGTSVIATAPQNNSANFIGSDLVAICASNKFSYSFAADDKDGDNLVYSFCEAYNSTSSSTANIPIYSPPYDSVPYDFPSFSSSTPLGNNVTINSSTGLISGIAPSEGIYVVAVCVQEIRNGTIIATQRKELQILITDCNKAVASLLPEYQLCHDTKTINIANQTVNPLIHTSDWEFSDNNGNNLYSFSGTPATYTFPDTGIYHVKLSINRGQGCSDSSSSIIKVYPGLISGFSSSGYCNIFPTTFKDHTTSVYGIVNSWNWDFGESSSTSDNSTSQNPSYTYPVPGLKYPQLIVVDTKGCRDSVFNTIKIIDKPPISLSFKDSLICLNDNIQLEAAGFGVFSWTPQINMINPGTSTPTVFPSATTNYFVTLNDNGCINKDSVKIRVVDHVVLKAMNDTTICSGDTVQLKVVSDALQYSWSPASQFIDPLSKDPLAITNVTTDYQVKANIGGCTISDRVLITTIPYPKADAGSDTTICYNTMAILHAATDGSSWNWTPSNLLTNASLLNPTTNTAHTTTFIFTAYDTKGCPKPGRDSIIVAVSPRMQVHAGNDTAIVINQPLQLNAIGGKYYNWSPPNNLSATDIPDPIALFNEPSPGARYKVVGSNEAGCADSSYITIKVYSTLPRIFIPSAFTPDNDGKNDILKPIAIGIKKIEYFNVYNRWGQLVYRTSAIGKGWDGKINGRVQSTDSFVWIVKGTDYNNAAYFQKGTVTLIRK